MRKRTQLVGFEFGYWKHSQYCAEFLDNSLDAIESFQWKEQLKEDSEVKFTLDQELSLESLTIVKKEKEDGEAQPLNGEAKNALMEEFGITPIEKKPDSISQKASNEQKEEILEEVKEVEDKSDSNGEQKEVVDKIIKKSEDEIEAEVKKILNLMNDLIQPVEDIIDKEPIVLMRLRETEAATFLTSELSQKNVMSYTYEIFDNGTGIDRIDLKRFGKYLASSKSGELKQTRGSQGFGAPSAFSDAQNTTGKPIIVVSKTSDMIYAIASEFFTTSKNEKKYLVYPTEIDCPFLHGTYINLNYLNVKYTRGDWTMESYVKEVALMNPHVTIIFIDPYNEEFIFPRKVSSFPLKPSYAKPHPSSTNIGDLQDLLAKAENLTISSFLQENFVRISSKTAKEILDIAERDIQEKLNVLVLGDGYVKAISKKEDEVEFLRNEDRIFGKSKKPREQLVAYKVESEELKAKYWDLISKYNLLNKEREKVLKEIKKRNAIIEKTETQKEIKNIEKEIKNLSNDLDSLNEEKDKVKESLNGLFKGVKEGLSEITNEKQLRDLEDLVHGVEITKAKPNSLTSDQFNSLFFAFKSVKYMAPPTDTAIPVGDSVLESTLIKDLGLKVSENLDDFDIPVEEITDIQINLLEEKKKSFLKENEGAKEEELNKISVDPKEIVEISSKVLSSINVKNESLKPEEYMQLVNDIFTFKEDEPKETFEELFDFFIENYTKDDDFISAETRPPSSGKGLAYVVEAVLAYSKSIEVPKRSYDVLSRFVNRTPKLRDNADCAITKAVQAVNWKNYKVEVYDNNLPKGPLKLLVNVSGPFVHLMFKSQSKSALADDEDLIKEIKFCLEAIGRRFRVYLNRRQALHKSEKRASMLEKYVPKFVSSLYSIASQGGQYKDRVNENELQNLIKEAIIKKAAPTLKLTQEIPEGLEVEASKSIPASEAEPINSEEIDEGEEPGEKPEIEEEGGEIAEKVPVVEEKEEVEGEEEVALDIDALNKMTVKELYDYCKSNNIRATTKMKKPELINAIQQSTPAKKEIEKPKVSQKEIVAEKKLIQTKIAPAAKPFPVEQKAPPKEVKVEPEDVEAIKASKERLKVLKGKGVPEPKVIEAPPRIAPPPPKPAQTEQPIITNEKIMASLTKDWQNLQHLIFKLKIKDMMDARFLQLKLKDFEKKGTVIADIIKGKRHWKIK